MWQCRRKAEAIFRQELETRKTSEASVPKNDLMESLMNMKDQDKQLSDTEVVDNIVSLVVAGYVSTSLAVMWALYYLAKYPQVLQKLRVCLFVHLYLMITFIKFEIWCLVQEEHMPISKKLKGDFITYEETVSCKYTAKVVLIL